jgi:DNA-binding GntR family transcriptional regulator
MVSSNSSLSTEAYKILLKRIVSIQYEPGTILNENGLVAELGISRTPIHSACIRLNQENLISFLPKKGIQVTKLDAEAIREIHDIRMLIEPYAIRNFGNRLNKDHLLEYIKLFQNPDTTREDLYEADVKMHMEIVAQTHNKLLCNYYASLQNQFERISNICGQRETERLNASNQEHVDMLIALINDDLESAEKAALYHLQLSREAAYRVIVIWPTIGKSKIDRSSRAIGMKQ